MYAKSLFLLHAFLAFESVVIAKGPQWQKLIGCHRLMSDYEVTLVNDNSKRLEGTY